MPNIVEQIIKPVMGEELVRGINCRNVGIMFTYVDILFTYIDIMFTYVVNNVLLLIPKISKKINYTN